MEINRDSEKIYMGFPDDLPPHYAYEAVQIFNDCNGFPEFVPNDEKAAALGSGLWLSKGNDWREIPFYAEENEKIEAESVLEYAESLQNTVLGKRNIAVIHGKYSA